MPEWIIVCNLLTFLWLCGWTYMAIVNLCSKHRSSTSFVTVVFFLLYGVPIFLDLAIGIPDYLSTPGLAAGANSSWAILFYDLFVSLCPVFWRITAQPQPNNFSGELLRDNKIIRIVLLFLMAGPFVMLIFAPSPGRYLNYGFIINESVTSADYIFYGQLASLGILSILGTIGHVLLNRNLVRSLILLTPLLIVNAWIQGKRSSVALVLVLVWFTLWVRKAFTPKQLLALTAFGVFFFGLYIYWYQTALRPQAVSSTRAVYENSRIDYGRDHHLKAAIECELSQDESKILDYRGQSILFSLAMFIPRSEWPDKPLPYAAYLTGFALQSFQKDRGWGLTSSILDEMVANFGWPGLLIGPALIMYLCRVCDKSHDLIVKVMGTLITCLFLTVEFVSFAPVFLAWAIYTTWSIRYRKPPQPRTQFRVHFFQSEPA